MWSQVGVSPGYEEKQISKKNSLNLESQNFCRLYFNKSRGWKKSKEEHAVLEVCGAGVLP